MVSVDLVDYYAAGYVLIRADHPGWESLKENLTAEKLISLSTCICQMRFSIVWGWRSSRDGALAFGISEARVDEFLEWGQGAYQDVLEMYSLFHSVEAARKFIERFEVEKSDLHLIGVGISKDSQLSRYPDSDNDEGVERRLKQRISLETGGTALGFEVASYAYHDFNHSWLCSGLEVDMKDLFDIQTNEYGLIDSYLEAKQVSDWIAEEPGRRGEPEPYDFWLLVDYPLQSKGD